MECARQNCCIKTFIRCERCGLPYCSLRCKNLDDSGHDIVCNMIGTAFSRSAITELSRTPLTIDNAPELARQLRLLREELEKMREEHKKQGYARREEQREARKQIDELKREGKTSRKELSDIVRKFNRDVDQFERTLRELDRIVDKLKRK